MKIVCLNCRSAYRMVALRGDKNKVEDVKKVTTRCAVCCDQLPYTLHDPPQNDQEKDQLRLIVLHDHLWPRVDEKCARARQDKKQALVCVGCKHDGMIDAQYCDLAKKYCDILVANSKVDDDDVDEREEQTAAPLAPPEEYATPDGDDQ